ASGKRLHDPRGGDALAGGHGRGGARPVQGAPHPASAGARRGEPRRDRLGQGPSVGHAGPRGPGPGCGARKGAGRGRHGQGGGDGQARRSHRHGGQHDAGREDQLPPRPRRGSPRRHRYLLGRDGVAGVPARGARAGEPDGGPRAGPSRNSSRRGRPDRGARYQYRQRGDGPPPGGRATLPRGHLPGGHHQPVPRRRRPREGGLHGSLAAPTV
ncbi:MAG: CBS domain protein AcuB, partial [uncultured Rubrobacteraceae bacterium]